MADNSLLVASALFVTTVFIIVLHAAEWFNIGTLSRSRLQNSSASNSPSSKLAVLKGGLGIETAYYFLLLVVFVVFFPGNLIFLTLVALLGLIHLAAFQAVVSRSREKWLQQLTTRRVAGVLVFEIFEVVILVALAFQFYPMLLCFFGCFS